MTEKEKMSREEAVKRIRAGERFYLNLPGGGRVRVPTPANLAFYVGLAVLVAIKLFSDLSVGIHWPTAVFIAVGFAITRRQERISQDKVAKTAAAIDQLRSEVLHLDERLDKKVRTNAESDQAPVEGAGNP
jgi:Ca2+-transporting ATPase